MSPAPAISPRGWEASLHLTFRRDSERTVLGRRTSVGPLTVQKALYPEGQLVCHAIVLHPPGGIVGGDQLDISVGIEAGAHALLTTPGATKWYRSTGAESSQRAGFWLAPQAVCEWMPQENIFFEAARARNTLTVDLAEGAVFCGWDVMCLGRTASGESFLSGSICQQWRVRRNSKPLFEELGILEGGSALLESPIGMAGFPVCATFIVAGIGTARTTLEACRAAVPAGECKWGITLMDDVLIARCLSRSAQVAREYFIALWAYLRPGYARVPARVPRIWAT
jgi:urease accessory protein